MFTKDQLTQKLYDEGIFIDLATLEHFLGKWNITPENTGSEPLYKEKSLLKLLDKIKNQNAPKDEKIEENLNVIKWQAWKDISEDL